MNLPDRNRPAWLSERLSPEYECSADICFICWLELPVVNLRGPRCGNLCDRRRKSFTGFDQAKAVVLCTALATVAGFYSLKREVDAPSRCDCARCWSLARMIIATAIFSFFGGQTFWRDAVTYDFFGNASSWAGRRQVYQSVKTNQFVRSGEGSGWGWFTLVAAVYGLIGVHVRSQ